MLSSSYIKSLFFLLLFLPFLVFADTPINGCQTLTTDSETYTFTESFGSGGDCLYVAANDITIDGAGYTLNGNINGSASSPTGSGRSFTVMNLTGNYIYSEGYQGDTGYQGSDGSSDSPPTAGNSGGVGGDGGNGGNITLINSNFQDITVNGATGGAGGVGGVGGFGSGYGGGDGGPGGDGGAGGIGGDVIVRGGTTVLNVYSSGGTGGSSGSGGNGGGSDSSTGGLGGNTGLVGNGGRGGDVTIYSGSAVTTSTVLNGGSPGSHGIGGTGGYGPGGTGSSGNTIGSGDSGAAGEIIIPDETLPVINTVSSDKPNGTYGVGTVIDIDVTFSEPVNSTGSVTVTLETGATDRTCTFTVSGSNTGTCNYTVQAGDTTSDLTNNSISGTIADLAGNGMSNFAPIGANMAALKAIVIDTTAPTISSISAGSITSTGAVITWNTNEAASSSISYGLTTSYGTVSTSSNSTLSHSVTLSGLTAGTEYNFRVLARDVAGNISTSTNQTFTTTAEASSGGFGTNIYNSGSGSATLDTALNDAWWKDYAKRNGLDTASTSNQNLTASTSDPVTTLIKGCEVGYVFNILTGLRCSISVPVSSPRDIPVVVPDDNSSRFNRDLRFGMIGEDVRLLQVYLNSNGYRLANSGAGSPGSETTRFGFATLYQLKRFQQANGLPATGFFGPLTRALIEKMR